MLSLLTLKVPPRGWSEVTESAPFPYWTQGKRMHWLVRKISMAEGKLSLTDLLKSQTHKLTGYAENVNKGFAQGDSSLFMPLITIHEGRMENTSKLISLPLSLKSSGIL